MSMRWATRKHNKTNDDKPIYIYIYILQTLSNIILWYKISYILPLVCVCVYKRLAHYRIYDDYKVYLGSKSTKMEVTLLVLHKIKYIN